MADQPDDPEREERVRRAMEGFDPSVYFTDETPLTGVAHAYAEVTKTFQEAGDFTRAEALYLAAAMFNGNPGTPPSD